MLSLHINSKVILRRIHIIYTLSILLLLTVSSCSTKKDAAINRGFHQMTAKYNGYFNGRESLKEGLKIIEKSVSDDYYQILPALKIAPEGQASVIFPQMDRAIDKATAVIQTHSMNIRGKEKNKWIDDNYLLIGVARFYKQEYDDALKTFDYVGRKFKNEETGYRARVWAVRCQMQLGNYSNARTYLDALRKERGRIPKDLSNEITAIEAEMSIHEEDYKGATRLMSSALKSATSKTQKLRYMFILGQLYQKTEKYSLAAEMFEEVSKKNPTYEMEFQAKMNRAKSFDVNSGNGDQIRRDLLKMVDDEQNKDYLDELYYTIADLYLREADYSNGKEYLRLAAANSTGNNYQLKAKVYTRLADMSFEDKDYLNASTYYDSTLQVLPKNDPRFEDINDLKNNLSELVVYLNTINTNDSLLRIASLDEDDRNAFVDRIIAQKRREEKLRQEAEQKKMMESMTAMATSGGPQTAGGNPNQGTGGWYFYNTQAISLGFSEFKTRWGNRPLEDNWRRKNKSSSSNFGDDGDGDNGEDPTADATGKYSRDFYLKQLPISDSSKSKMTEDIVTAYYKAGLVYKDKLKDFTAGIKNYLEMERKHPENVFEPNVYYALYKLHLKIGAKPEAEKYKQLLLAKYPNSDFAKATTSENGETEVLQANAAADVLYNATYTAFKNDQYALVISNTEQALTKYPNHNTIPRFKFIDAISKGKVYGANYMQIDLRQFVKDYPSHELTPKAEELLSMMGDLESSDSTAAPSDFISTEPDSSKDTIEEGGSNEENVDANYLYDESLEGAFNYIMVIPNKAVDMNSLKVTFSDFNKTYFSKGNYSVKSFFLDSENQLISVSGIPNGKDALQYFNAVYSNPSIKEALTGVSYKHFVISQSNFGLFYGQKDVGGYLLFFNDKLLNEQ